MDRAKLLEVARQETSNLDLRFLVARALLVPLPIGIGNRVRAAVMRACGFRIGPGTTVAGTFRVTGGRTASSNISIGRTCFINHGCLFDASDTIDIGDHVAFGQHVVITTNSHASGSPERRAGALEAQPVRIGDGAWVAAGAIVLPGVEVGAGSIVCAGAVVTRSVPPHTMVGGVPARPIRDLPTDAVTDVTEVSAR